MALIKCHECGKEVSSLATACPNCGCPIEKNNNKPNNKGGGCIKESIGKKKWIIFAIAALTVVAIIILFFMRKSDVSSSDVLLESDETMPLITSNGVDPIFLGKSLFDIPPSGLYYDTILLNEYYNVQMGDHIVTIDKNELKEYYHQFGDAYDYDVDYYGEGAFLSGKDTILTFRYSEDAIVNSIMIFSDKLKLENGIRVGTRSEELIKKYQSGILFLPLGDWYSVTPTFRSESVPDGVLLLSNIRLFSGGSEDAYYIDNIEASGHLKYIKNWTIEEILIVKDGNPMLMIEDKPLRKDYSNGDGEYSFSELMTENNKVHILE